MSSLMDDLPNELIHQVLSYLSMRQRLAVSRVCRLWRYFLITFNSSCELGQEEETLTIKVSDGEIALEETINADDFNEYLAQDGWLVYSISLKIAPTVEDEYAIALFEKFNEGSFVRNLDLSDRSFEDREYCNNLLNALKSNRSIKNLNLNNNGINNEIATKLFCTLEHGVIEKIDLANNLIDNEAMELLSSCCRALNIVELDLRDNKFDDDGATTFFESLGDYNMLCYLER